MTGIAERVSELIHPHHESEEEVHEIDTSVPGRRISKGGIEIVDYDAYKRQQKIFHDREWITSHSENEPLRKTRIKPIPGSR